VKQLGYRPGELVGRSIFEVFSQQPELLAAVRQALDGEESTATVSMGQHVFRWWCAPRREAEGHSSGAHGVATEIIEPSPSESTPADFGSQQQTEQALQQSEARWRLLLQNVPEYILSVDPSGVLMFANRFDQPAHAEEFLGKNLLNLVPPDHSATVRDALARVTRGESATFEIPWVEADGRLRWFENRMGPLVRSGRVTEIILVASDITDRKNAEGQLRQAYEELERRVQARTDELRSVNRDLQSQKKLLELVLNSINSGVLVVDEQGELMLTNPAAHSILGLERWQTINVRDGRTFLYPDQATPYAFDDHPLGRAIRGETLWAVSMYAQPPGVDHGVWLTANAAPLLSEAGAICGGVLVFRDDTERRKAEESLRLSLERFDLTVHGSREGLWDAWINSADPFDPNNPVYYSPRFKESVGYADDEFPNVLGSWVSSIYPEDRDRVMQSLAAHLEHRVPYDIEYRILAKGRVLRWFNARGQASWDSEGNPVRMSGSFMDITARKEAEEALRTSELRYRRLVETANVMPWEMDFAAGRLTYVGPQATRLLGYPIEEWYRPNFWFDHLHSADRKWVVDACRETLRQRTNEDSDLEYRLIAADGSTVWVRDIASVTPRDGKPALLSGFMFDITDRKKAERDRQESEARLQAILDGTPSIVQLKDLQGRYVLTNRAHEQTFGFPRERLAGKRPDAIFAPELVEKLHANDRLVIEADQPITFEETIPTSAGVLSYLSVKFPLHDPEGEITGVCGISTDITERKRAEEHLLQEQDFLRGLLKAHERDRQLMAYEIHDGLVQDITAGLWHLEGLSHALDGLTEKERGTVQLATGLLRRSINDARRVLSGLRPPILDEEGIVLAIQYLVAEQAVPGELEIDFTHDVQFDRLDSLLEGTLFRIVQESLNNIKRHSGASRAEVRLTQRGETLRLEIRDWGRGFNIDDVSPERFGLQGIRKRAALFGGRGEIHSTPGEGTQIIVELPLTQADNSAAAGSSGNSPEGTS
jgi:PAS domain S-box-containing protein